MRDLESPTFHVVTAGSCLHLLAGPPSARPAHGAHTGCHPWRGRRPALIVPRRTPVQRRGGVPGVAGVEADTPSLGAVTRPEGAVGAQRALAAIHVLASAGAVQRVGQGAHDSRGQGSMGAVAVRYAHAQDAGECGSVCRGRTPEDPGLPTWTCRQGTVENGQVHSRLVEGCLTHASCAQVAPLACSGRECGRGAPCRGHTGRWLHVPRREGARGSG